MFVSVFVDLWLCVGGRVSGVPPKWSVMYNLPSLCLWLRQLRERVKEGAEKNSMSGTWLNRRSSTMHISPGGWAGRGSAEGEPGGVGESGGVAEGCWRMGGEGGPHSAFISSDYFSGVVCVHVSESDYSRRCHCLSFSLYLRSIHCFSYTPLCHTWLLYSNNAYVDILFEFACPRKSG